MIVLTITGIRVLCPTCNWSGRPGFRVTLGIFSTTVGWECPVCGMGRCAPKLSQHNSAIDTIRLTWGDDARS